MSEGGHDGSRGRQGLGPRQILKLLGNRRWLIGTVMIVLAVSCQLGALALSPLAVVQPVGVLALVVSSWMAARTSRSRLGRPAVRAVALCVIAVVVFVTVASLTTRSASTSNGDVIRVLIIVASIVTVLAVGFLLFRNRFSRIFYVIAAGSLFGLVATLAKVILGRIETVIGAHDSPFSVGGLTYVCLGALIVAGLLGQYFQQTAYASGSPEVIVAGLTVVDPIVGVTVGLAALHEASGAPAWAFVVFGITGAAAIVGVALLSRNRPHDDAA